MAIIAMTECHRLTLQVTMKRKDTMSETTDPTAGERVTGRLVAHPEPGKVWVQVPHRNDIGSDWIEADELPTPAEPDAGDVDRHPEDYCHKCGGPNISWFTPGAAWDPVMRPNGDGTWLWDEIICPPCFVDLAGGGTWHLIPAKADGESWTGADERAEIARKAGDERAEQMWDNLHAAVCRIGSAYCSIHQPGNWDHLLLDVRVARIARES